MLKMLPVSSELQQASFRGVSAFVVLKNVGATSRVTCARVTSTAQKIQKIRLSKGMIHF